MPESVESPSCGKLTNGARVPSDDKRTLLGEGSAVAGAQLPPAGGGVDKRVDARLGLVGVEEVGDPVHHGAGAETVALVS